MNMHMLNTVSLLTQDKADGLCKVKRYDIGYSVGQIVDLWMPAYNFKVHVIMKWDCSCKVVGKEWYFKSF